MTNPAGHSADLYREGLALLQKRAFPEGVAMLEQAAARGHPDAQCRLATLEAAGIGRPQDWQRALDLLKQAADNGSEAARSQLGLLASEATRWSGAADIALDDLLAVPERESLCEAPRIRLIRGFASPALCAWIVSRAQGKLAPAMTWDELGSGKLDPDRSNSAVELQPTDMDVVTSLVRTRISRATRLPEPIFEAPQVMHYAPGQEFRPHHDFLDPHRPGEARDLAARGQRIATFLLYLNEDYEGGETDFPRCNISWSGSTGDALFFANVAGNGVPDPLTLHAGKPPSRGEKWVFSQWIRDRSPEPQASAGV